MFLDDDEWLVDVVGTEPAVAAANAAVAAVELDLNTSHMLKWYTDSRHYVWGQKSQLLSGNILDIVHDSVSTL